MIGDVLGSYEIVQQIGRGGMGAVYLAQHTLLKRRVALKVLLPAHCADPETVNRFFNEARVVTSISDPGIVQVFDFGYHTDGSAFLVMELLDGEPMDKRLRKVGRLGVVEALRLARMICTSLGAAHAVGVVHRDLKPENIFIVRDSAVVGGERAKILDFGIAKLSGDDGVVHRTRTGALMGTPLYMSPEQCRSAGEVDHRSDIYALGCVVYAMLTGRPPFEGDGLGDLLVAHLQAPPPRVSARVPGLPPAIDQIVQRCLAKTPAERFGSMAELVRALDAAEVALAHAEALGLQSTRLGPGPGPESSVSGAPRSAPAGLTQWSVPPVPPVPPGASVPTGRSVPPPGAVPRPPVSSVTAQSLPPGSVRSPALSFTRWPASDTPLPLPVPPSIARTTLSTAFGETSPPRPERSSARLAVALIGTLVVGAAIVIAVLGGRTVHSASPIDAPSRIEAAPTSWTAPVVDTIAIVDAGVVPNDAPVAPALPGASAQVPSPAPGGAPARGQTTKRPSSPQPTKGPHAKPATTQLPFDRGD